MSVLIEIYLFMDGVRLIHIYDSKLLVSLQIWSGAIATLVRDECLELKDPFHDLSWPDLN